MRMRSRCLPVSILVLLFAISAVLLATKSHAGSSPQDPPAPPAGGQTGQERPGRPDQSPEPRPYERVITKDAKSDEGIFTIHTIKEKFYYEIPKTELNKEFLWVSQIARTTLGVGYGGQAAGNRVVRWERKGNRILLRNIAYDVVADSKLPVSRAVQAANNDTIIMAFNIEAFGKDESAVIDVSRLFTTEVTEFSARIRLRARGFDPSRSFIEKTKSFPTNIEVEVSQTYTSPPDVNPAGGGGGPQPTPNPFAQGMRAGTNATVVMHYSMVKLPEKPMMPRLYDERVGYFSVRQTDYGVDEQRAPQRRYITRWRLEKKDPNAEISEPVHTLGFQHNMKASATYAVERVRDPQWLRTMGHTPTLMDYSRFNYVAQPEDNIPLEDLIPAIGPYDKWATMWGYKPIPGAKTADEEKKTLDTWAREQDTKPWLRFSTADSRGSDPGENTEAVGDGDAIVATGYGIKNLKRVADMLLPATSEPGEPYDDLEELYGRMLGQWATELNHVTGLVGGFNSQQKHGGQDGVRFTIVSRERQMAAVRFLNENAFATPTWALRPEILRRIEPSGAVARVNTAQERVLNSLMSNTRFDRLVEQEAIEVISLPRVRSFLR